MSPNDVINHDVVSKVWFSLLINCASYAWSFTVDSCWYSILGVLLVSKVSFDNLCMSLDWQVSRAPPSWCHPEAAAQTKLVPSLNHIKFYSSGRNDMKQETLITGRRSPCRCSGGVLSLLNATQVNGQLSASLVATVPVLTAQNAMPLCCRACHGMSLGSNGFKLLQQIAKGMDTDRLTPSASHDFLD